MFRCACLARDGSRRAGGNTVIRGVKMKLEIGAVERILINAPQCTRAVLTLDKAVRSKPQFFYFIQNKIGALMHSLWTLME